MSSFSTISWREQVRWDNGDDFHFVLDQHAQLDFFHSASSLKQQSSGIHVAQIRHITQTNLSLLLLLDAAYLAEKQQIPIFCFWLNTTWVWTHDLRTRGKHANHYTTHVQFTLLLLTWLPFFSTITESS